MSIILPNLIVGSFHESFDTVESLAFTHVLNVASECVVSDRVNLVYYKIGVDDDCPKTDMRVIIDDCLHFIKKAHAENGIVFVHCLNGVSRSVCVVLAYLVFEHKMSFADAYDLVLRKRPIIDVYPLYLNQIIELVELN